MNKPLISVIVPNYNHEKFLMERLESIFNQSYQDFEVILLDDCSKDRSWDILLKYSNHPKVSHCVRNEVNSGSTFRQWKKGLDLAKGEWIWIAESDDFCEPHFLEETVSVVKLNDNIGLVFAKSIKVNTDGNRIVDLSNKNDDSWKSSFIMNGIDFIKKHMLLYNSIPNASAILFNKETLLKVGGINKSYTLNGDWDIYVRILSFSRIAYISKGFNYFRQHPNSGSRSNIKNGNNIKEYYWLIKTWRDLLLLNKEEYNILKTHVYHCWKSQCGKDILTLLRNNFLKIFTAALNSDSYILLRVFLK